MDPHSPNKLFATKYCFPILGDEFLFLNHFFIFRVFFFVILCYFVIINFYKNYFIIIILFNSFFFTKITLIFSCSGMFRDVPGCSGMFRNVPCSWFYRRPSRTAYKLDDYNLFCLFRMVPCRYTSHLKLISNGWLSIVETAPVYFTTESQRK